MKNKILPVGHKILCKKLDDKKTMNSGIQISTSSHGNMRFEIVALPEPRVNPWIETLDVGDIVICKEFDADTILHEGETYYILDMESEYGYRAGQIHCVIKKDK